MSVACAQHMPAAQTSGHDSQQSAETHGTTQLQKGTQEQGRQSQAQHNESQVQRNENRGQRDLTTGQGPSSQTQPGSQIEHRQGAQTGREHTTGQNLGQQNPQSQPGNERQLGQSGREQNLQRKGVETQGQASQPQQMQHGQAAPSAPSQFQQGQTQPQGQHQGVTTGQAGRSGIEQTQASGGVTLTNEQRTEIRQTVLARSDAPRVERVNFALSVGTAVPTYVRVVEVPETLVTIHPDWRGDMYFVTGDDVVIVDHSRQIVAVLPVGSGTRSSSMVNERGSTATLSRDEIRQVQIMLNQKGFNLGEPDGVLGPRTRQALTEFQRKQGFQASGQMDQETLAALGISGGNGRQGTETQPSTTGRTGPSGMNEPNMNQQGVAPGQRPGTAATQTPQQGRNSTELQGRGPSSTTGQANPSAQEPAMPKAAPNSSMQERPTR
jgi:peptidoglycan hydrolase-like protein with peptidoglycan-binding domain